MARSTLSSIHLPTDVQDLYATLSSESERFVFRGWTFLAKDVIDRMACKRQHMIPLAVKYTCMGLYRVIEYVPAHGGYFVHGDGGSNEYQRAEFEATWNAFEPAEDRVVKKDITEVVEKLK